MKFYYCVLATMILGFIFIPGASLAGRELDNDRLNNIYVISIGISGGISQDISSKNIFIAANYQCPTCLTDASGLTVYLKKLRSKLPGLIDSVITYQYTNSAINIDTIYKVFLAVQRQARASDVFVFYYAGSNWGTIYNPEIKAEEGIYFINNKYDQDDSRSETENIKRFSFTLRQLKALTDRIASQRQLIVFDTGHGDVIETEFYRNFFSNNPVEANFTKKNRIVICPESVSAESFDIKDQVIKGDLFKVISNMPDTLNVFNLFDTSMKSHKGAHNIIEIDNIRWTTYKKFMSVWYEQQLSCFAQIKILKELDYVNLLMAIRPTINSDERGIIVAAHGGKDIIDSSYANRKKKALIVATNYYDEASMWPPLRNPVNDGKAVASLLQNDYGYEVTNLYDSSRLAILQAINDICSDVKNPYSQYIIYVAGHGFYDATQKTGYLVCKDSKKTNAGNPSIAGLSSYIDYTTIFRKIDNSLNKIVFITDVCFGGTSLNSLPVTNSIVDPKNEKEKTKNPFKKALTSGITEVDDFMRLQSGGNSENSPFASALLEILKNNKNNLNFEELYSNIRNKHLRPTPIEFDFGTLTKPNEFIF